MITKSGNKFTIELGNGKIEGYEVDMELLMQEAVLHMNRDFLLELKDMIDYRIKNN